MNSESKLGQLIQTLIDKVVQAFQDSPAFQQLKAKYEELDPKNKLAVLGGGAGLVLLLLGGFIFNSALRVRTLKQDLADRNDLIRLLHTANEDLRKLKDEAAASGMSRGAGDHETQPAWAAHFETTAVGAGIQKEAITISGEKAGTQGEQTKEALFDIGLKKVNLRQLAKFSANLESGLKPIKIRSMSVDAKPDGSAWLDATLSVSAFSMKSP
jgi:hypothetical protein